jgi:hypothetical protein
MPINSTSPDVTCPFLTRKKKTSLFISLCILRDLPSRRSPGSYAVGVGDLFIFLGSHVLIERFFDGTDQENSKTQGGKRQIRGKIHKNNSIKKLT